MSKLGWFAVALLSGACGGKAIDGPPLDAQPSDEQGDGHGARDGSRPPPTEPAPNAPAPTPGLNLDGLCRDICADWSECSDQNDEAICTESCIAGEQDARDSGCEDFYEEVISCTADAESVCGLGLDLCRVESYQYYDCIGALD